MFIAEPELPLVAASQGYSLVVVCGFLTVVASHCRAQSPEQAGFSRCGLWALEHWLSNCDLWA